MKAIFDFQCTDCLRTDDFYIENTVKDVLCKCGGVMRKSLCAPSNIKVGKFSTTIDSEAWAKSRTKNAKRMAENLGL